MNPPQPEPRARTYFHGARASWSPGSKVPPEEGYAWFSDELDAAIWAAELAPGDAAPVVYRVAVAGPVEDAATDPGFVRPPHPSLTLRTRGAVEVVEAVTEWRHYHGTRAALQVGELIKVGHTSNYGPTPRSANYVYFTRTLDASVWGAELAQGEGPGRIYVVEPTGPFEDDPNLTNVRFRGNPTKSFRSQSPLRVVGELSDWKGHPAELVEKMRAGVERLAKAGVVADD